MLFSFTKIWRLVQVTSLMVALSCQIERNHDMLNRQHLHHHHHGCCLVNFHASTFIRETLFIKRVTQLCPGSSFIAQDGLKGLLHAQL